MKRHDHGCWMKEKAAKLILSAQVNYSYLRNTDSEMFDCLELWFVMLELNYPYSRAVVHSAPSAFFKFHYTFKAKTKSQRGKKPIIVSNNYAQMLKT